MSTKLSAELKAAIKTEYIGSNISYRDLAEKYDVSAAYLNKVMNKEHWKLDRDLFRLTQPEKVSKVSKPQKVSKDKGKQEEKMRAAEIKRQHEMQAITEAVAPMAQAMADHAAMLKESSEKALGKINQILELDEPLSPRDIKAMTGAMMDLRNLFEIKTDADRREQEARIAAMQKQAQDEGAKDTAIEVVFSKDYLNETVSTGTDS